MNVLLINSPSRKGKGGCMLPLGLIYVGGIIKRYDHDVRIIDPYLNDIEECGYNNIDINKIYEIINDYKPTIIGYGGIATSYGIAKYLSNHIRLEYPEIFQIAGGALSSVYRLLLTNTGIDLVFHGETEVSLPIFLSEFAKNGNYAKNPGVSYRENGEVKKNKPAPQIEDIDSIPFPDYNLVNLRHYFIDINDWIQGYASIARNDHQAKEIADKIGDSKYYIPLVTSRGCTHRCLFCYRHFFGIRKHSVNYVINHIKFIMNSYGIRGFQFVDELFNPTKEWVTEFCKAIRKENIDIFYMIGGARVDKIDIEMIEQLKETGCIEIDYGQESGSDIILKEYRKGVTSKLNKEITIATKAIGLHTPVQLVIGSPGETTDTIWETIRFLKEVDGERYSLNYLIPLPETPVWKYVEQNNLVKDVESYLDMVAEFGGTEPLINLTKCPDREWQRWLILIRKEMLLHYSRDDKRKYFYYKWFYGLLYIIAYFVPKQRLKELIPNWLSLRIKQFFSMS
jgi:anaerobic magnesium-protoporphyrin IX monomethyl ester cyclase